MSEKKTPVIDLIPKEELEEYINSPSNGLFDMEVSSTGEANKINSKIQKLMKFFEETGINYDDIPKTKEQVKKRVAYPNYDQYQNIPGQHNLQKWLDAVRKIQASELYGWSRTDSIRNACSGWNITETYDFLNWIKFYQEGTHLKYKTAQLWYENGQPGYFLQIKQDAPKGPEPRVDIDAARDDVVQNEEKKRIIEKRRQKIIGRLDSAEKLLRSPEGQVFAGKELENLMEAIYNLKKKVQLVNKLSTSTRLYEDMIVREGNILRRNGFIKAAELLYSVAQANNPPPPGTGTPGPINTPPATPSPDDPSGAGHPGLPGTLPSEGPGQPVGQKSPPSAPSGNQPADPKSPSGPIPTTGANPPSVVPDKPTSAVDQFISNMEGKTEDKLYVEDTLEVNDEPLIVTEAQLAPGGSPSTVEEDIPLTTAPSKPKPIPTTESPEMDKDTKPLEVTDDSPPANEMGEKDAPAPARDFDRIIDSALANVSVVDVVAKLEDIAKIFKTREIPRQLSLVDMMLDSLGLSTYFPTLSEAINKSLESNNYVSTRLEDIIARLRGAMVSKNVDLKGTSTPRDPGVAKNLQDQQNKEDSRKKMRKEQEAAELQGGVGKETPEVEIGGDLAGSALPAPATPPVTRPPTV